RPLPSPREASCQQYSIDMSISIQRRRMAACKPSAPIAALRQRHREARIRSSDGLAWKGPVRGRSARLWPEKRCHNARFRYFSGAGFACMHPLLDRAKSIGRPSHDPCIFRRGRDRAWRWCCPGAAGPDCRAPGVDEGERRRGQDGRRHGQGRSAVRSRQGAQDVRHVRGCVGEGAGPVAGQLEDRRRHGGQGGDLGEHGRLQGKAGQARRRRQSGRREREGSRFLQGGLRQHRQERLRRLSREVPRQEELTSRDHAAFAPPKVSSTHSAQTAIRLAGTSRKPGLALARGRAEKTNIVRKLSRRMRTVTLIAAGILVAALAVVWMLTLPATVPASALPAYTPNVDNGGTMSTAGGCASCHATPAGDPDKVDRTRLGGGLALKSPFGTFYVPNISPDPSDGIGEWSEANF